MRSIADLPFVRKPAMRLLGLEDECRTEVDREFAGFGWGVLPRLVLTSDRDPPRAVNDALVLALHTPDEPGEDLELEFWLEHDGEALAVLVPWDAFASAHVRPLLSAVHRDVVLALCNPLHRAIERPVWVADRRLHYADGDVTSWLDPDGTIRLQATRWHLR
jgi:hypothetical protein